MIGVKLLYTQFITQLKPKSFYQKSKKKIHWARQAIRPCWKHVSTELLGNHLDFYQIAWAGSLWKTVVLKLILWLSSRTCSFGQQEKRADLVGHRPGHQHSLPSCCWDFQYWHFQLLLTKPAPKSCLYRSHCGGGRWVSMLDELSFWSLLLVETTLKLLVFPSRILTLCVS